jgi:hypothetical protein
MVTVPLPLSPPPPDGHRPASTAPAALNESMHSTNHRLLTLKSRVNAAHYSHTGGPYRR